MKALLNFKLMKRTGSIIDFKTRDIAILTFPRTAEMFKNVRIPVLKKVLIYMCVHVSEIAYW